MVEIIVGEGKDRAVGVREELSSIPLVVPIVQKRKPPVRKTPVNIVSSVDKMIDDILIKEGGFVDHPADRGGATNFGISTRFLRSIGSNLSVKNLTEKDARKIYREEFYKKTGIGKLPNFIQSQVFDTAVNSGPSRAIGLLQQTLINQGFLSVGADSGIVDSKTIAATNKAGPIINNALVESRKNFYSSLIKNNPTQAVFRRGWMKRAESFRDLPPIPLGKPAFNTQVEEAFLTSPEEEAKRQQGEDPLSEKMKRKQDINSALVSAPATKKFLEKQENLNVAQDTIPELVSIETSINTLRSMGEGVVGEVFGRGLTGTSELLGVLQRGINQPILEGLDALGFNNLTKALTQPLPWWLDPQEILRAPGEELKKAGEVIGPAPEDENFITQVGGGVGQVAGQITLLLINPIAGTSALLAQGADIQAEKIEEVGVEPSIKTDIAIAGGAAITGLTEKFGLNILFNKLPASQRSRIFKIFAGAGTEGTQEILENVLHNLTALGLYNPNEQIFEGALEEGAIGAVVGGLVEAAIPGKTSGAGALIKRLINDTSGGRPSAAVRAKSQMDKVNDQIIKGKLETLAPETAKEHRIFSVRQAGVDRVFIPMEELLSYAQQHEEGAAQALRQLGITAQLQPDENGDVAISGEIFATEILGTDNYSKLSDAIKFEQGDMTASEAVSIYTRLQSPLLEELDKQSTPEMISSGLKKKTKKLIDSFVKGEKTDIRQLIKDAPADATSVLDSLVKEILDRESSVSEIERKGRLAAIDKELQIVDRDVEKVEGEIEAREKEGKPIKRLEQRLDKLSKQRDVLVDEQIQLEFPIEEIIEFGEEIIAGEEFPVEADEIKKKKKKDVLIKSKVLKDLDVDVTQQSIRALRRGFRSGVSLAKKDTKAAQTALIKLLKGTGVDVSKFVITIRNTDSQEALERKASTIQTRVIKELEKKRRTKLIAAIKKELSKTAPKKQAGRPVGKFGPEVQELLDAAKAIMSTKVSKEEASNELEKILSRELPSVEESWVASFYAIKANDENLTNDDLEEKLFELASLKAAGRNLIKNKLLNRRKKIDVGVDTGREAVRQGLPLEAISTAGLIERKKSIFRSGLDAFNSTWQDWETALSVVFDKKGADQKQVDNLLSSLRMGRQFSKAKELILKWEERLMKVGVDSYSLENQAEFIMQMHDYVVPQHLGNFINARGEEVSLDYTRDDAIEFYMKLKDESISPVYFHEKGNAYTEEMAVAITKLLSKKDRTYANNLLDIFRGIYPEVNTVYKELNGISLPFNEMYSPLQRDRSLGPNDFLSRTQNAERLGTGVDTIPDEFKYRRKVPGQLKSRVASLVPIKQRGATAMMHRYIHDMSHYIATAEQVQYIASVFGDAKLRKDIERMHSKNMLKQLDGWIRDFSFGYPVRGQLGEDIFGRFNRNFAKSVLAFKPTIGAKQLTSYFAMGEGVPPGEFIKGSVDFAKNRKDAVKWMWEHSPALRVRGSSLDFEIASINTEQKRWNNWTRKHGQKFDDLQFLFIRMGDRSPIYMGGWARIQHDLANGVSEEQAIINFERIMNDTQQSTDLDRLASLQRAGPVGRMFTMFMTSRLSLLRGEMRAIRQFKRGKIDAKTFGRRMAIYHVIIPQLIQYISSGFEFEEDRQFVALLFGQLNSFVILGDILSTAVTNAITDDSFDLGKDVPLAEFVADVVTGVWDAVNSDGEIEEILTAMNEILIATGKLTGKGIEQIENIIIGGVKISQGEPEIGTKMVLGYSAKVAEKSSVDKERFDMRGVGR